ncbi:MAG: HypC/HybG/HupF family hydrogenase formation chaperone [Butyrivibrio sp.]|nr:HypC/HybG/HupF family hydrogenase formation chaperone [Butyrivibrio sp.]
MCVASPGIIKKIENNIAEVDYNGNTVKAHTGVVDVSEGDYVLVHAGMVLQKMNRQEAEDMLSLFKELEEL